MQTRQVLICCVCLVVQVFTQVSFRTYFNLTETQLFVRNLSRTYQNYTQYIEYGQSFEGYPLFGLYISNALGEHENVTRERPIVLVTSLSHGREWISGMASCHIAEKLLEEFNTTERVDYLILPVLNPDGFNYTVTKDRLWRKSRSRGAASLGYGVDLDANYPSGFGMGTLDQKLPMQLNYIGESALSEPETFHFVNYTNTLRGRIKAVVDFQAYGQFIFSPLLYQKSSTINSKLLSTLATNISKVMTNENGIEYKHKPSQEISFTMGGTLIDYMYEYHGAASFAITLRDKGLYKWLLPEEQIIPTCQEAYAAVKFLKEWVTSGNSTLVGVPIEMVTSTGASLSYSLCIIFILYILM